MHCKKNGIRKRVLAWGLCVALLLGMLPMGVLAVDTAPVVSDVAIEKIEADEYGDKYMYLTLTAEGGVTNCELTVNVDGFHDPDGGEWRWAREIEELGDSRYRLKVMLDPVWYGQITVTQLFLMDQNGEWADFACEVTGIIPRVYTEDYTIGDITIDGSAEDANVTLSADNLTQTCLLTAPVTAAEGAESYARVDLILKRAGSAQWFYVVGTINEGTLTASTEWSFDYTPGTYEVIQVRYQNKEIAFQSAPAMVVTQDKGGDEAAPELKDLYFTVNGERVETGFAVKAEDTLKVHVKLADANAINWVIVNLESALQADGQTWAQIFLSDEDGDGVFEGGIDATTWAEMVNSVWCVTHCAAKDVLNNSTYYQEAYSWYFTKTDAEGNYEMPTVYTNLAFQDPYNYNTQWANLELKSVTSLNEIIAALTEMGYEIVPPEVEGLTFEGWYLESAGKVLEGDEPILANGMNELRFWPKYDKLLVKVDVEYANEFDQHTWAQLTYEAQEGDTVADLLANLDTSSLVHTDLANFTGWKAWVDENTVLNPAMARLSVAAQYDKVFALIQYTYCDAEGENWNRSVTVPMEPGATCADVWAYFEENIAPTVEHYAGLGEVTWTTDDSTSADEEIGTFWWFNYEAEYEKVLVFLNLCYINAEGEYDQKETALILDKEQATYDTAITAAIQEAEGLSHAAVLGGVTAWEHLFSYDDIYDPLYNGRHLYFDAAYEKLPVRVNVTYAGEDGLVTEELLVGADEGATYQQVYDALELNVPHRSGYTFVEWTVDCSGEGMDDTVHRNCYIDVVATYESYQVELVVSYLGGDGQVVTSTKTVEIDHGTSLFDYVKAIPVPEHAMDDEFQGWALNLFDLLNLSDEYINASVEQLYVAAQYESKLPVHIEYPYVAEGLRPAVVDELSYIDRTGSTEEALMNDQVTWIKSVMAESGELTDPSMGYDPEEDFVIYNGVEGGWELTMYDEETGEEVPLGIYCLAWFLAYPEYEKTVLVLTYPDGTTETKLIVTDTDFVLPETADGKELVWHAEHYYAEAELAGGETLGGMNSPYVKLTASYADGSEYVPVNPFTDVHEGAYYYDAVLWAVENGITAGTSATEFSPKKTCTRGQIALFLYRAAGKPALESTESPFPDVTAGGTYGDAILWAYQNGITAGTKDGTFNANAPCTRGQIALFLYRAAGKPALESTESPFPDVTAGGTYGNAILWAYQNGITTGQADGTFGANNPCQRSQIVTFLYRMMVEQGIDLAV